MKNNFGMMRKSAEYEQEFEWDRWVKELPFIQFPKDWQIKIIPPFCGTIIRFLVKKEGMLGYVSVYFDGYEVVGLFDGQPYWEVYPYNDDVGRCAMNDIKTLLQMIKVGLKEKK